MCRYDLQLVSHHGDVPVSRSQHFQDHLDLLEGRVSCILVLLTLHTQGARVDVGSCAPAKMFLLGERKQNFTKHLHPTWMTFDREDKSRIKENEELLKSASCKVNHLIVIKKKDQTRWRPQDQ